MDCKGLERGASCPLPSYRVPRCWRVREVYDDSKSSNKIMSMYIVPGIVLSSI